MAKWIWQRERAAALPPGTPSNSLGTRVHTATDGRDVLVNSPDGWEVDAPWLWWLGPNGSDGTGGPWGNPLTNDMPPGSTLPAVSRCTSLICDTLAGMPWQIIRGEYEKLPTPDWILDPQSLRIDERVVNPDSLIEPRLSAVEFWAQWICAALWWGDGYLYVPVRDAFGAPKPPLWQLHPFDVRIEGGSYWVSDYKMPVGSIIHLRGMLPYWNLHGKGVLTNHAAELGLAATVRGYAGQVFQSGVPFGYLQSTAPSMTQDAADALKAKWLEQHGTKRSIAVLNATTSFHPISISPVDAQLNTTREWVLRDICLAFGIPAYMVGVPGDSSTYANIESRESEFRTHSLLPWQRRIESVLDAQLPRGTTLKIKSDALLRADTKPRYEAHKIALESGFLTINEVREMEDRPPLAAEGVL